MSRRSNEELVPKNGHTLRVLVICRISGCSRQKEASIADQEDNAREAVAEMFDGPVTVDVIATKAKGEALDRPELDRIEAAYQSGEFDLVVIDDLSRLIRGGEASRLLGVGVDHGTRTVCLQDGVDTIEPTWEQDALNACSENVGHNERTSLRIKQKTMNRFKKFGQSTGRPIVCYVVPEGAKSYDDWIKDLSKEEILKEGKKRLQASKNASAVADWFNSIGFPVGPYSRRKSWNGAMVRRLYRNPILKGKPWRGSKRTVKNHSTGRRVSRKNPKGPIFYNAPHLAFFDELEFDDLNAMLDDEYGNRGRPCVNGSDPLLGVSRKRSRFPGKCARCWFCGWEVVWGGNGISNHLMCNGAREWHCWNSVGFDGPLAARKLADHISTALLELQGLSAQFAELVDRAQCAGREGLPAKLADWRRRKAEHDRAVQNLQESLRMFGPRQLVKEQIDQLEAEGRRLTLEKYQLDCLEQKRLELPESVEVLSDLMREEFARLAIESYEFADFMRPLISSFYVYLVRLLDGGGLFSRAKVVLNLAGNHPDINLIPELHALVTKEVTIDLWDLPPQREQIRLQAVQLAASDAALTHKQIGQLTTPRVSGTAVGRALALHKQMLASGLTEPWVLIQEPPLDIPKRRRHRNAKYEFQPVESYVRPQL